MLYFSGEATFGGRAGVNERRFPVGPRMILSPGEALNRNPSNDIMNYKTSGAVELSLILKDAAA